MTSTISTPGRRGSRSRPPRTRDEQGTSTVLMVLLSVALLVAGGLVIDGGYALAERRRAMNAAEQAARLAADQVSEPGLRSGLTRVEDSNARAAALTYLGATGWQGSVTTAPSGRVTVSVVGSYRPAVLSLAGVGAVDVRATATALSIDQDDVP